MPRSWAWLVLSGRQPSVSLARLPAGQRVLLALAVVVNGLMNLVLFFAFGAMAVGLVMAVFYLYPVLVALMSAALGRERLTPVRVLALAIACAGLALVLGSQLGPEAHATAAGIALAGVAATCHAVYLVVIRGGFDDVPGVQATSLVLAGGLVISGTAALVLAGAGVGGRVAGVTAAWAAILCAGDGRRAAQGLGDRRRPADRQHAGGRGAAHGAGRRGRRRGGRSATLRCRRGWTGAASWPVPARRGRPDRPGDGDGVIVRAPRRLPPRRPR